MDRVAKIVKIFVLCYVFAGPASAEDEISQAVLLFENEVYSEAFPILRQLAESGNSDALYYLGIMFRDGLFVDRNNFSAAGYLIRSSEQNNLAAKNALGELYLDKSEPLTYSPFQASKLFREAAIKGFADAQYNLGISYLSEEALTQNVISALMWIKISISNGKTEVENDYNILARPLPTGFDEIAEARSKICIETFYEKCFEEIDFGLSVQPMDCEISGIQEIMLAPEGLRCILVNSSGKVISAVQFQVLLFLRGRTKPAYISMPIKNNFPQGIEPDEAILFEFKSAPSENNLTGSEDVNEIIVDLQILQSYDLNGRLVLPKRN